MAQVYEERERERIAAIRQAKVQDEQNASEHNRIIGAFKSISGTEGVTELRKWLINQKELCLKKSEGTDIGEVRTEKRKNGTIEVNIVVIEKDFNKISAKIYSDILNRIDTWIRGEFV